MAKFAHSAIFVGFLVLGATRLAYAQPKSPEETTMAEAKQRFSEGIKFADAGDNEAARLKFNQAWSLLKSPSILYNLARAEQLSNHPVEALEHYRLFGKMASDPKVTEQQRQRATENIAKLSTKVSQVDIEAPATARITIDGTAHEWAPGGDPIPVLPGKHVVEAVLDGKGQSITVECEAGTVAKAKLNEPPPPPAPAPAPAAVVEPPKEQPAGFWTTGRAVGAGVAGAGLIALGAGVIFQLKAGSLDDDATKLRNGLPEPKTSVCSAPPTPAVMGQCTALKGKADDLSSAQTLRTVFFAGGGALLVGGVVLFLVSPPKNDRASAISVLPFASANDAGVQVVGRF